MPMLIEWWNPESKKHESMHSHFSIDSGVGQAIIKTTRVGLRRKHKMDAERIGFRVKQIQWRDSD